MAVSTDDKQSKPQGSEPEAPPRSGPDEDIVGKAYDSRLMRRLGLTMESGAVRASLVHYNTVEEVRRFGSALAEIKASC